MFWPEEKVQRWQSAVFSGPAGEVGIGSEHLITMAPDVHRMWSRGLFALKPISLSDDRKELLLQFFWQKSYDGIAKQTHLDLMLPPVSQDVGQGLGDAYVLDRKIGEDIFRFMTGDKFVITTNDPETHPLPSFDLLEMQWYVNRVVGMCVGAGPEDEAVEEEGSDDNIASLYCYLSSSSSSSEADGGEEMEDEEEFQTSTFEEMNTPDHSSPARSRTLSWVMEEEQEEEVVAEDEQTSSYDDVHPNDCFSSARAYTPTPEPEEEGRAEVEEDSHNYPTDTFSFARAYTPTPEPEEERVAVPAKVKEKSWFDIPAEDFSIARYRTPPPESDGSETV